MSCNTCDGLNPTYCPDPRHRGEQSSRYWHGPLMDWVACVDDVRARAHEMSERDLRVFLKAIGPAPIMPT